MGIEALYKEMGEHGQEHELEDGMASEADASFKTFAAQHSINNLFDPIPGELLASRYTAVSNVNAALDAVEQIGYPIILWSAFTLGDLSSSFANNPDELCNLSAKSLSLSDHQSQPYIDLSACDEDRLSLISLAILGFGSESERDVKVKSVFGYRLHKELMLPVLIKLDCSASCCSSLSPYSGLPFDDAWMLPLCRDMSTADTT
ncbi:hypothetical protein BDR03DRAFT_1007554 [Suillus americanus]|nr:hypothetical protein BDR03DRAFT_1007554 [Suillus americanus]